MPVLDIINHLIETFGRNIETYRSGSYNETQLHRYDLNKSAPPNNV